MAEALPKVWNTRFPSDSRASVGVNYRLTDNDLSNRILVSNAFLYPDGEPLRGTLVPECMFAIVPGDPLKGRNWVRIYGGLYVISESFRNVLVNFDLGTTQIVEVPFVDRQGAQQPGHWYLFHISELKSCLVPEQSRSIKKSDLVDVIWKSASSTEELLAVNAGALEGVDLWVDPHMSSRIFFSDRLKSAITDAGIRSPGITLHRCLVIP